MADLPPASVLGPARILPPTEAAEIRRVLIVDPSPTIRAALTHLLDGDPAIRVVGQAEDGAAALVALAEQAVDVAILDAERPGLDGAELMPLLLRARPGLRVVVARPGLDMLASTDGRDELLTKVKARADGPDGGTEAAAPPRPTRPKLTLIARPPRAAQLLAIGSSTGGPQALFALFQALGRDVPVPLVVTQHMPAAFIPILAGQLDRLGGPCCHVAEPGVTLLPGHAYLAAGDRHLLVHRHGEAFAADLSDAPPEHHCRPAVDPMLRSAAIASRGRTLVVILTGMGCDGLAGTAAVIAAGGAALAQDEASSVVWGMPGAVALAGLCHEVGEIPVIARTALRLLAGPPPRGIDAG